MGMRRFVLPKQIRLPGGFIIRVEVATMAEDSDAECDYSVQHNSAVIRLRKGMTVKQMKYHLSHELLHVVIDYHHAMMLEGGEP